MYLSIRTVLGYLQELDIRVTRQTIRNWMTRGLRPHRKGNPVKLRSVMRVGRLYTTIDWLSKFLEETT